jgi:tRNA modification GTPase
MEDTIVAISTSQGIGAISIIRLSGKESIEIVNKIVKNKNLNKLNSHTINYNHVVNNDEIIDEVLISIMKAPRSFTTEDVVEINCHGGIATTNKILELLLLNGCRLAEPGEFTKRAFLNGRIDLLEAESVMDIINSKTENSLKLAINQLNGSTSNLIRNLRQDLLEILANIAVNIDYPEYEDIEEVTNQKLEKEIIKIKQKVNQILNDSKNSKIIKEGIDVAIIGKPNVGKSSLLNKLLDEDKAIVTDIAGTTRDIVEGKINLNGFILNIIDTAGIRKTTDKVEQIGVDKSKNLIDRADLILFLLDNNTLLNNEEKELLETIQNKKHIIIVNKTDLETKIDLKDENYIRMSTINNIGIKELKERIIKLFELDKIEQSDMTYLTNARSIALLKQVKEKIEEIENSINMNIPISIIEIDLRNVWEILGKIIGEHYEDELIDQLFTQFCLGK